MTPRWQGYRTDYDVPQFFLGCFDGYDLWCIERYIDEQYRCGLFVENDADEGNLYGLYADSVSELRREYDHRDVKHPLTEADWGQIEARLLLMGVPA